VYDFPDHMHSRSWFHVFTSHQFGLFLYSLCKTFHRGLYVNCHHGRIPYTGDVKMITDGGGHIILRDGGFLELDCAQVNKKSINVLA
jgi:hypothetical protein